VTNLGTMRGGNAAASFTGARAAPHGGAANDATAIHPVVRWALYAFVLALPFEYPDRTLPFDVTTLMGSLFLLATLVQPRACYGQSPWAFGCFVAYLFVFGAAFVRNGGENPDQVGIAFLRLLERVLILWAAFNVLRRERVLTTTLVMLAVGCLVLALLQLSGLFGAPMEAVEGAGHIRRITVLGQNPNRTARMLSLGVLALIGLTYGRPASVLRPRLLVWPVVALLGVAIVGGGSRGALVALAAGLWTFTATGQTVGARVRNAVATMLALALFVGLAFQSPLMRQRLEKAEIGNLAGREEIFPAAWEMFRERPLLGWGPIRNKYELATRLRSAPEDGTRDAHNLVLELLTATGLLGAVLFLMGLGLGVVAAWRARHGSQGILPLAMMASVLASNMSGTYLVYMPYWLALAYALASASLVTVPRRPDRPAMGRPGWRSWDAAHST
jgi:O-antigen ligase